ncbi:uncharacterized protein LOC116847140 isoform X2 [Odontomachus brunneus]|uniref:uncharacterized protein LOC116847140 isoform X2 n=1 Tax=Odontomachus brunneus TaxID=486640 RepID=UPI0013F1A3E7|nr:uncharacterized protein LOC116847140 isoform X2 [Odontomachus brunneus]
MITGRRVVGYVGGRNLGLRVASRGVPQGSILSPLLFNFYISGIHGNLGENVQILAYADDVVLYSKNMVLPHLFRSLSAGLDVLSDNLAHLVLTIAAHKTKGSYLTPILIGGSILCRTGKEYRQETTFSRPSPGSSGALILGTCLWPIRPLFDRSSITDPLYFRMYDDHIRLYLTNYNMLP